MDDFQDGECLGPFCEGADAAVDVLGADEGDEEEDAAEDGGPEYGAHEIVCYEVVLLLLCTGAVIGGFAGVHLHGLVEWSTGLHVGVGEGVGLGRYRGGVWNWWLQIRTT